MYFHCSLYTNSVFFFVQYLNNVTIDKSLAVNKFDD